MTKTICIIGGTGFIGSHLSFHLANAGWRLRLPTRRPHRHRELRVQQNIDLREANVHDPDTLRELFDGVDAVVNLAGILNETGKDGFDKVHVELPRRILAAMQETGVRRLLHMRALNADPTEPHSRYLRSKGEGEQQVMQAGRIAATSFRPSVVFGPGDSFFNRFASLLRLSPLVFPLACPEAKFAPVYVGDVVEAFEHALHHDDSIGQVHELCGPTVYSLRELVQFTARQIGQRTLILGLPDFAARLQARLLGLLPGKPFSLDNYYSLQRDSVCSRPALPDMGIDPHSIECMVPAYLAERSPRGIYQHYRRLARRGGT